MPPATPQTPLDKFFSPFDDVAIIPDTDASSDALFEGQDWQNLCFGFTGLTAPHTLTLPLNPTVGERVTVVDADRSATSSNTLSLNGNGAQVSTSSGSGSTAVAVSSAGGWMTVMWTGVLWAQVGGAGAPGAPATTALGIYGLGTDGAVVCDGVATVPGMTLSGGNYTLNRDCYFTTCTINTGVTVFGASFRLFCSTSLTVNGHFSVDGQSGTAGGAGGGAGANNVTARLGGGQPGGNGTGQGTLAAAMGGSAGASSFGTSGGTAQLPLAEYGGNCQNLLEAINGYVSGAGSAYIQLEGGCGGGGAGGSIGGGGAGVGVLVSPIIQGTGSITANGGTSSHDSNYSGGGGGGGWLVLVSRTAPANTLTITALGGIADTTHAGAVNGSPGTVSKYAA